MSVCLDEGRHQSVNYLHKHLCFCIHKKKICCVTEPESMHYQSLVFIHTYSYIMPISLWLVHFANLLAKIHVELINVFLVFPWQYLNYLHIKEE